MKMDQRQLRAIMLYEHRLKVSSKETAKKINTAFGPGTTSDRTVRFWYKRFDTGDISCGDQPRPGRPTSFDEDALRHELELHPDYSTRDLEKALGQSHATIDRYLKSMGYRKVMSRWTPHALTDHVSAAFRSSFTTAVSAMSTKSVDFEVFGRVQGVFFRKHTKEQAEKLGLRGWCKNTAQGTVLGHMQGPTDKVESMMQWLKTTGSPTNKIEKCEFRNQANIEDFTFVDFSIRKD